MKGNALPFLWARGLAAAAATWKALLLALAPTSLLRAELPPEIKPQADEYDRAMAATGIYAGRQVPVPGQPDQMEDYGWTEHSARRVSQPARTHLREVLLSQGFELR